MARRSNTRPAGGDRLDTYRAKRDFDRTAEPSGASAVLTPGHRFVVQRHRASRLHYDLRLEMGGVLVSWAVPKGPTLDPDARRMAVHVEDHPLDYFDFEGTIPAGEYGGGDVIVWDWGTWVPDPKHGEPLDGVAAGDLHFDLLGEKLRGRFVLVRRGPAGSKEQWILLHKHDDDAVAGWDPEAHPRSVKSGRTNDEVLAAPAATWVSGSVWAAPTSDEIEALDALGRAGTWAFGGHDLKLTNLDKTIFPRSGRRGALTKRDLVRHMATMAPVMLPYLADRPTNLHRFPDGVEAAGFWQRSAPNGAPDWIPRFHHVVKATGVGKDLLVLDSPAALAWAANNGAVEVHPWTSTAAQPEQPTWALIDIDPGERTTFDDVVLLATLHRTALDHLGLRAGAKVTGQRGIQIWIPVGPGHDFDDTRTFVERLSRLVGGTVPELISWQWAVDERDGLARLDYTQNALNKTLVAPFSPRANAAATVSVPIAWDELDDPDLRPDRWDLRTVGARLRETGDPLAPLVGLDQRLPEI